MKKNHFFRSLCCVAAALVLTGCSDAELADRMMSSISPVVKNGTISPDSKWINSTIDGSIDADTPVSLKDDFYTAINKDWLIRPLGKGEKNIDKFDDIEEQFEDNMYYIMTADPADVSGLDTKIMSEEALIHIQELVHIMLDFGRDADTRNALGAEPLRPYIEKISAISTLDDMTDYICNTDGSNLFSLQLAPFLVNSPIDGELQNTYTVYIMPQPVLALKSREEYTNLGDEGTYYLGCNRDMLQYILGQLGYTDAEVDRLLRACYRFETKLIRCIPADYMTDNLEYAGTHNNLFDSDSLNELSGNYPLIRILSAYGLADSESFTVEETTQLKEVGRLYTDSNLEDMKAYFIVNTVLKASYLLDDTAYDKKQAYSRIRGTNKKEDEEDQPNKHHPDYKEWYDLYKRFVTPYLGDAWQQVYIGHFCSSEEKQSVLEMTEQIMSAFEICLRDADWMSEETRSEALDKLHFMGRHVLYPDNLTDYSSLSFDGCNNLVDIAAAVNRFSAELNASKVNRPVDQSDWDLELIETTIVNAFYKGDNNSINIPAALLADNYIFNPDASYEENLAKLGSVLGHELTHGFDTNGYQFNKYGNYHSWWTKSDRLAFDMRANDLIKYYSGLSPVTRNNYLDGENVSGEAIADMGGVKCGMILASEMPGFDYNLYFRSYAELWREHSTYKYAIMSEEDEHPANMLRVNVTLTQFEEFQKTYDIQPGDGMYLAAEDRILVW